MSDKICPGCGHPEHKGMCIKPVLINGIEYTCSCGHNRPADQPEKHCTLPDGHIMAGGLCQHCPQTTEGCQYWGNEQPTPTMPLREQEQLYGWDLDKRLDDFKTIAERLEDENYHSRAKAVLYLIERCKRAEAHDSEVAKQAVKEFAERVIMGMPLDIIYPEVTCPDCDKPTEWQEGYKTGANSMKAAIIKGIKAMAEE